MTMLSIEVKHLFLYSIILIVVSSETVLASTNYFSAAINGRYYPATSAFVGLRKSGRQDTTLLYAQRSYSSDLDTAYEWLSSDRVCNEPERHKEIRWFHPTGGEEGDQDSEGTIRMPLYPLGAVHVPHAGEYYTIINIEQKNVKMAMDLVNGEWENSLFCACLRARDTNRIASVGTIMQLIDTEDRSISGARTWPGNVLPTLNRVVANCKAVGVVDIVSIEENDYKDDDYLIARVKIHNLPKEAHSKEGEALEEHQQKEELDSIAQKVIEDYQTVRSIYINSQSLASNELPKFARNAVQTLPTFDTDTIKNELEFWMMVETWQMLCNTIRQAKRTSLQSIVNELSVSVAMQTKGPLELPVKRKSLPLDVQRQLENIEESASKDFMELGMDPVLDFQEILSMKNHWDRVKKLAWMIQRERARLEAKESLIRAFLSEELGD